MDWGRIGGGLEEDWRRIGGTGRFVPSYVEPFVFHKILLFFHENRVKICFETREWYSYLRRILFFDKIALLFVNNGFFYGFS